MIQVTTPDLSNIGISLPSSSRPNGGASSGSGYPVPSYRSVF